MGLEMWRKSKTFAAVSMNNFKIHKLFGKIYVAGIREVNVSAVRKYYMSAVKELQFRKIHTYIHCQEIFYFSC
jgi:hypothetical protein